MGSDGRIGQKLTLRTSEPAGGHGQVTPVKAPTSELAIPLLGNQAKSFLAELFHH